MERRGIGSVRSLLPFSARHHQTEDAMLLYIFWASLCLGLMRLPAEANWQEQNANRQKLLSDAGHRGAIKAPDRTVNSR
jgi:hypothetical protein